MKGALHSQNFTGSHSAPATFEAFEKMDASKAPVVLRGNGRIMANRDSGLARPALLDLLCASAASQMLWQQAETLTTPSSRLCRSRWGFDQNP